MTSVASLLAASADNSGLPCLLANSTKGVHSAHQDMGSSPAENFTPVSLLPVQKKLRVAQMKPLDIIQTCVDAMSKALVDGDWPSYLAQVTIPFTMLTGTVTHHVDTEDKLRLGFDAFHEMLKFQKVKDYVRIVETASHIDEMLITGRYTSHYVSGGTHVIPPFNSGIVLRLVGRTWRCTAIANSLHNSQWPLALPMVPRHAYPDGGMT